MTRLRCRITPPGGCTVPRCRPSSCCFSFFERAVAPCPGQRLGVERGEGGGVGAGVAVQRGRVARVAHDRAAEVDAAVGPARYCARTGGPARPPRLQCGTAPSGGAPSSFWRSRLRAAPALGRTAPAGRALVDRRGHVAALGALASALVVERVREPICGGCASSGAEYAVLCRIGARERRRGRTAGRRAGGLAWPITCVWISNRSRVRRPWPRSSRSRRRGSRRRRPRRVCAARG